MKTKLLLRYLQNLKWSVIRPATAIFLLILALSPEPNALSQIPQGFNYQAIARDPSNGNPITGANMQVKIGILSDTIANTMVWEELFNPVRTNAFGMFTIVVGTGIKQSGSAASFSAIDWTKTPLFIRTSIYYPSSWKTMGTAKLQSVPYSMVAANLEGTVPLLSVKGNTTTMDSALFVVRNNTGQIVFAVYNEGVRIYVDDGLAGKGRKGGFAIGSFDKSKGQQDYFVVTGDSIRAYIDTGLVKTRKGGFAIGSFDKSKAGNEEYFRVTRDSTRIYIDDTGTKKAKGGFAIGGFDKSKSGNTNFLNIATDANGIINPSQNRILWYPIKNAFLTGKVLIQKPDSVGENSFASGYESKAKGMYSQALGYKAIARGDYSTAIGKNAIASKANSFSFGDSVLAVAINSYAFGKKSLASGSGSYAFGTNAVASGSTSYAFGTGAKSIGNGSYAFGYNSVASGISSYSFGQECTASGLFSTAMGGWNKAIGNYSFASGVYTTAEGYWSCSMGISSKSVGTNSFAIGEHTVSQGETSFAGGSYTSAFGKLSTSFGYDTKAKPYASLVIGQYNDTSICYYSSQWDTRDPILIIGNGIWPNRSNAFTVFKNGNTAIGHASPTQMLDVNGNARFRAVGSGAFAYNLNIMSDGTLTTATSDIRMKENIYQISNALEKVNELRGVSFTWKNDSLKTLQIGMIAQEVERVVPEIVFTNPVDGLKGINYSQASALFVEAIKEQQKQIEGQQKQIESINQENQQLKSQVQTLQGKVDQIEALMSKSGK